LDKFDNNSTVRHHVAVVCPGQEEFNLPNLAAIIDQINQAFEAKSAVRDKAITRSRELIRHCANSIRATQRGDDAEAQTLLKTARQVATEIVAATQQYPDVYHAGYTQDALKELAEAHITRAVVLGETLPTPEILQVEHAAYLNGLAEAAGELRRFALDALRRGDVSQAERILSEMDEIYSALTTVDFPEAITGGLRRNTDMVRGVLERTRGDVTTAVRQETIKEALAHFEQRIGLSGQPPEWTTDSPADDEA
jgi:translin